MRKSHIAMLTALGVVVLALVSAAGLVRIALSQLAPDGSDVDEDRRAEAGDLQTRTANLENFRNVRVSGRWNVTLVSGTDWNVDVTYPEDDDNPLDIRVDGDDLILSRESGGWRWWKGFGGGDDEDPVQARVVMPELAGLSVAGGSAVDLSGFEGDRLEIMVRGASDIDGRDGRYEVLDLNVGGVGNVNLRGLPVHDAHVDVAGVSDVTLTMDGGVLSGRVAGVGGIEYYGQVSDQRVQVSGVADVDRAD